MLQPHTASGVKCSTALVPHSCCSTGLLAIEGDVQGLLPCCCQWLLEFAKSVSVAGLNREMHCQKQEI